MENEESKQLLKEAIAGTCNQRPRSNNKILALGKYGQCLLYDSMKGIWEEGPSEFFEEMWGYINFSAVIISENIFIIGGLVNNVSKSNVSIYNLKTKSWKNGPQLQVARFFMVTCVSSTNSIYVVGGLGGNYLNSVEMLNCDENGEPIGDWQRLPPMKTARSHFEAAIVDDKVYAMGGFDPYITIETMEVFDPKVNRWSDCKSMPQIYEGHTVSTFNGEIYVFGVGGSCEKYNPVTDTWTAIAALNTQAELRGSAVLNDKIYIIGGGGGSTETDIYDIKTNTWSKGPPMPKEIGWTKCVLF